MTEGKSECKPLVIFTGKLLYGNFSYRLIHEHAKINPIDYLYYLTIL